ncbi:sigma-70 family RNA polymerase sigma factor [Promicromonospora thailandica]|uniref:RNA polymerase sigma-70 factor, ECF subfamily n=1 Tax=Promicromonospora thailandica TaxID=765201 RepID=A0A9X2G181_9MICO|nr:sigma-70 family RNA polymerase sigma factor [Promicromonospora thailandica]MCP2263518.1 RNA polymerase sigma-70 factor, ECF subfamily [Promicromonospora thailandica]BFF19302.1 SigE family RNA polymerase sigma factor [Promicromonospora thailandica]
MGWHEDLELLATERGGVLVGYAYTLCGDVRQAEDLVQEALVRYCSRLVRPGGRRGRAAPGMQAVPLDGPDEPERRAVRHTEAYVRRMVLNLYLDGWRRRRRWSDIEPRVAVDDHVRFPDSGITARADVVRALDRLTPRQRACVVLRYFEDLSIEQVADRLGNAPGTVKRHLHDALRVLRDVLEPAGSASAEGALR